MATIAAIIASQALISGSFTIFSEAMNLKFWPRQKIKYPTDVKGQLYIPFVNMSLFILCVLVILFFQSSERMEAAYGLSITITMLMTTFLLSAYLTIRRVNRWLTFSVPYCLCRFGEYLLRRKHGKVYEWRLGNHASCQCDDSYHVRVV